MTFWPRHSKRPRDPFRKAQLAPRKGVRKCSYADGGVDGLGREICAACGYPRVNDRHDLPERSDEERLVEQRILGESE